MPLVEAFRGRGHKNIRASHRTTLMVTRDPELTIRGDCIVAVEVDKGPRDFDQRIKDAMRKRGARIRLTLETGGFVFKVSGRGDPGLTLNHSTDMVARKSGYICERTIIVDADKAACDIPQSFLKLLQKGEQVINLTLMICPV